MGIRYHYNYKSSPDDVKNCRSFLKGQNDDSSLAQCVVGREGDQISILLKYTFSLLYQQNEDYNRGILFSVS